MDNNYAIEAANWWASQIRESLPNTPESRLEQFKEMLSDSIALIMTGRGCITISTYQRRSQLLDEIASKTSLRDCIPSGFEMKIILKDVYVYGRFSDMVASF